MESEVFLSIKENHETGPLSLMGEPPHLCALSQGERMGSVCGGLF